jgi:hypothetical protein
MQTETYDGTCYECDKADYKINDLGDHFLVGCEKCSKVMCPETCCKWDTGYYAFVCEECEENPSVKCVECDSTSNRHFFGCSRLKKGEIGINETSCDKCSKDFDEHEGVNNDDGFVCPECADAQNVCEHCGDVSEDNVVHSWGCVRLCDKCSVNDDGTPHCPRGGDEECEWCYPPWKKAD